MGPEMPDGWELLPFEEAIDFREGPGILAKDFHDEGVPLIRLKGLSPDALLTDGCNYLDPLMVERKWNHFRVETDDTLLSTSATLGRVKMVKGVGIGAIPYTGIIRMRPRNPKKLLPKFIPWLLRSPHFQQQVEAMGVGSVLRHFGPSHLRQMFVVVPSVADQHRIAGLLGALDERIDLNRSMNRTLETIGRTLLRSRFIDFDGHDDFVQSDLGPIPRGWSVVPIKDRLSVLETGKRPKGGVSKYTSGVPSVGAESIVGVGVFDYSKTKYIPEEFFDSLKRGVIEDRDVLIYKDGGKPGDFRPHVSMFGEGFPFESFAINSHVYRLRTRGQLSQEYLYFWLSSPPMMAEMRRLGTGAAIPGIPRRNLVTIPLLIPSDSELESFQSVAGPVVTKILFNSIESRTLATIRDTLLPRLISGELRMPDAEAQVEMTL